MGTLSVPTNPQLMALDPLGPAHLPCRALARLEIVEQRAPVTAVVGHERATYPPGAGERSASNRVEGECREERARDHVTAYIPYHEARARTRHLVGRGSEDAG